MRSSLVTLGCVAATLFSTASAQAAPEDPLFVFTPLSTPPLSIMPPPTGYLEGPCGLGVHPNGNFYVSDYYHDAIDAYDATANYASKVPPVTGATGYLGQIAGIDPLDGPCQIAFDNSGRLYVNDYHRAVLRYPGLFGSATTITGSGVDQENPTGLAVEPSGEYIFVDERDRIAYFHEAGIHVMDIGEGSLGDGYGLALSQYPATAGYLYVPDAATNTIKVYDPEADLEDPIEEIDGSDTPNGEFVSFRDAAIAVDRATGEIYVSDNLQPAYTEKSQAVIYVFAPDGAYEGHLKFLVTSGMPVGLAVDNSATATQGRVYVTSGNTVFGAIYAYGPGAATTDPIKLAVASLSLASAGSGDGAIQSSFGESACQSACEEELPAGATVYVSAEADPGSTFEGWSGACSGGEPTCEVRLEEAAAVRASFSRDPAPQPQGAGASLPGIATQHKRIRHAKNRRKAPPEHSRAHRSHRRGAKSKR